MNETAAIFWLQKPKSTGLLNLKDFVHSVWSEPNIYSLAKKRADPLSAIQEVIIHFSSFLLNYFFILFFFFVAVNGPSHFQGYIWSVN